MRATPRLTWLALLTVLMALSSLSTTLSTASGQTPEASASPVAASTPPANVKMRLVADGLADPVAVRAPNDGTGRIFVMEKIGRVRIIDHGKLLPKPFIDLTIDTVSNSSEQGLYDIAFHPDFVHNGLVYVSHTQNYMNGSLVVWEYKVSEDDPNYADRANRRPVLAVQRRVMFHNGGTIAFGPDGYLYVAIGDGRPYPPPFAAIEHWSQSLENLDGKLLRIDVNVPRTDAGKAKVAYLIPENPFGGPAERQYAFRADTDMNRGETFPEIWAKGLRNPWGFTFDPQTGDLYIPDVGNFDVEEIDVQRAGDAGGQDYGWDKMEGDKCTIKDCSDFTPPVYAYPHDDTHCSIIGLAVYRGAGIPSLNGAFLFSDFCAGDISALRNVDGAWQVDLVGNVSSAVEDRHISGGGNDAEGNVYVTTCTCSSNPRFGDPKSPSLTSGAVWQIVPDDESAATPVAETAGA
ncbi:MAG: PQQ-dependent sugar dehydrogenase [Thermomicrobiales bacterium]